MTDVKFEGKELVSDVDISSRLRLWASKYSNISPMMNSKGFWNKRRKHNLKIDIFALVININSFMAMCTTLCDKVCQWLATGFFFSPVSFTNKTDGHDITEILLKNQPTYLSLNSNFVDLSELWLIKITFDIIPVTVCIL